jgi:hypothetical protein
VLIAAQELHRQVRNLSLYTQGENLDDVRMPNASRGASFAQESLDRSRAPGQVGMQELDGDAVPEGGVFCLEDGAHAAAADPAEDAILA